MAKDSDHRSNNLLDVIRTGSVYEMRDVHDLATTILDPQGRGLETHWQKRSYHLLVGTILHVVYRRGGGSGAKAPTLTDVDELLLGPEAASGALWEEMLSYQHYDRPDPKGVGVESRTHPAVAKVGRDMKTCDAREGGAVLSTARHYLKDFTEH